METVTDNTKSLVLKALEEIRPFLAEDGGDVELVKITDDMHVHVRMIGACADCEMSKMTLKAGIEQVVKRHVPEVLSVISVNDNCSDA